MMRTDRRRFVMMTASAALAIFVPAAPAALPRNPLSPLMAARIYAMHVALASLEGAAHAPPDAVAHARDCVENTFMTTTACSADEDAVMMALDAYEEIYPYAFAMQTARDLFTPLRYRTYAHERLRHWLLTDPEEEFAKSDMPGFLREMRARHRRASIST